MSDCTERVAEILAAAMGRPTPGGPLPEMGRLPFIQTVEGTAPQQLQAGVDDSARPVWVRGHVANIGDNPAQVAFASGSGRTEWYTLPPSAVLELSWYTGAVQVRGVDGQTYKVQVLMQ